MVDPSRIQIVVKSIKNRRDKWCLSTRHKNLVTLVKLGVDQETVFDEIYQRLNWRDYISGPESDNHIPAIPGDVWVFGMEVCDRLCYLKFQDRPNGVIMWISLHCAEYSLNFPY
ncbi:hypothetical protein [Limosilactobacillus kribbianus]|uniref:hypothetical protein n=1 Tax=Limosilactobacillus kribbianus TaxID=2982695 RepID=UPI00226417C1|nr:hypothetical protein [Limosilactobacillus kribbianus]